MATPESKAKSDVTDALGSLLTAGDIFWYSRMQSGMFTVDGAHCHASEAGTFDLIATFQDKNKNLCLAFIEVKRADKPAFLSDSQEKFKKKYDGKHANILFWLVQSGEQVTKLVLGNCYDRLKDIEM
jgi:hypothetical protein